MDYMSEYNKSESGLLPFDLIVVIQDVMRRWLVVVLVAVMVGVGAYIHTDMQYEPVYRTTTTFVVTARGSSSSVYSNLTSTNNLASVFTDLLNSSIMRKTILQEMGISSFDGSISTAVIPETNLINMTVTASDPWTAFMVAQTAIEHHESLTYKVVDGIVLDVLQYPTVPMYASNSLNPMYQMKRMMALAAMGTIVALAVLAFFRNTVRSEKEARRKLDCYYLGQIPHERKHKTLGSWLRKQKTSILITDPFTSFLFVETMRKLRRRIEQQMHSGKVLMVTSLLENEGKSTVAVNLALAMAQKRRKVLLIDCDMRKPACHSILEHKKFDFGVRDVLRDKVAVADAIQRYKKTNVDLLLEKTGSSKSNDLITSQRMEQLLEWARQEYDFVILDMPPIYVASDSESMKELADASLLVVRQNVADAKALNKAVAALDGGKAKLLGCVLNNVYSTRTISGRGGYGYGRYHGYNYYGRKG